MLKDIGANAKAEEMRRLRRNEEEGTETILVRLGNEEQRREAMEKKKRLKNRKEKIVENLT